MAINLVTFAAQTVTPQDDALIYESALTGSGMIYGGTVTIKSANVLRVAEGHGALCGRKFTIEAMDVPIALTPSGSLLGRIYIHMDLADTDEPISIRVETASSLTPVIQDTDVNINNGVYEINLATFTVDTATISNLVNVTPDLQTTQELSKQVSNSGDAYSPNRAYKVGELAIHDNVLYRCITACSAAAWDVNNSCFVTDTLANALTLLSTGFRESKVYGVVNGNTSGSFVRKDWKSYLIIAFRAQRGKYAMWVIDDYAPITIHSDANYSLTIVNGNTVTITNTDSSYLNYAAILLN